LNRPLKPVMPISVEVEEWRAASLGKQGVQAPASLEFGAVYQRWFGEVSRWVRAMGGPDAERDDLVQDVFLIVHRRLPHFDGSNVAGWLYRITRHRVRDFRRLLWVRHLFFGGVPLSESLRHGGASPADSLETSEKRSLLERLLEKLNEQERAAFVLFEIEGYTCEAIAEFQGVRVKTVSTRIYRGRKKLKAALAAIKSRERRGVSG
jgi:RNA polymerase sigma-70 factor (ECF subfamily)